MSLQEPISREAAFGWTTAATTEHKFSYSDRIFLWINFHWKQRNYPKYVQPKDSLESCLKVRKMGETINFIGSHEFLFALFDLLIAPKFPFIAFVWKVWTVLLWQLALKKKNKNRPHLHRQDQTYLGRGGGRCSFTWPFPSPLPSTGPEQDVPYSPSPGQDIPYTLDGASTGFSLSKEQNLIRIYPRTRTGHNQWQIQNFWDGGGRQLPRWGQIPII